jgi:hypothetical protein
VENEKQKEKLRGFDNTKISQHSTLKKARRRSFCFLSYFLHFTFTFLFGLAALFENVES